MKREDETQKEYELRIQLMIETEDLHKVPEEDKRYYLTYLVTACECGKTIYTNTPHCMRCGTFNPRFNVSLFEGRTGQTIAYWEKRCNPWRHALEALKIPLAHAAEYRHCYICGILILPTPTLQ